MGIYNYYGPDNANLHYQYDVKPYNAYGNVKNRRLIMTIELFIIICITIFVEVVKFVDYIIDKKLY